MILEFITKLKSKEVLTEDVMKGISGGICLKFEIPISYECKCENGHSFQVVITDVCDIDFYRTYFCNDENMTCNSEVTWFLYALHFLRVLE